MVSPTRPYSLSQAVSQERDEKRGFFMANVGWQNAGHFYAQHVMPCLVDCNFIVDVANGNNIGIRSLKGPLVASVVGHSSVAPSNTTPPVGYLKVSFNAPFNKYYGGFSGFIAPSTGSTVISSLSAGTIYIITSLGTSTTADWILAGVPLGVTPAVGVTFLALGSSGTGTGTCATSTVSGVSHIEIVGDPNTTLYPVGIGAANPYIFMKYVGATNSSTTTPIATQPADNSVVGLAFYFSNSGVTLKGE